MPDAPVVLSYGMGVDSTAIVLRWLLEPWTRDFPLRDLTVLTAMTGDEFPETGELVEEHVLPVLRRLNVRYAQVARRSAVEADGVETLSDTRQPERMFLDGAGWKLSDELTDAGTIPQVANGQRRCTQHFKGWPLDTWLKAEFGKRTFRHAVGFSADELKRQTRDRGYTGDAVAVDRRPFYPLIEWGWTRQRCLDFIREVTGVDWPKSCCTFCPFARDNHLGRYRENPDAAVQAMKIELLALGLNERSTLFSKKSVIKLVEQDGNDRATHEFYSSIAMGDWSLYDVRRILYASNKRPGKKGTSARAVKVLGTGSAVRMHNLLRGLAGDHGLTPLVDGAGLLRARILSRTETFPTAEHELVVAPAGARSKQRPSFESSWQRHVLTTV